MRSLQAVVFVESLLLWSQEVSACAGGINHLLPAAQPHHLLKRGEEGYAGCVIPEPVTCQSIGSCPYDLEHGAGPWTVADNLRQMQLGDDAFNTRDIAKFNHRMETKVLMGGGIDFTMPQHVQDILRLIAMFPDIAPHNHPYKIEFGEGDWTVAVADLTATNTGPLLGADGNWIKPTGKGNNFEMASVVHWGNGTIITEYLWQDTVRQSRQLGFLPDPVPVANTVGLSLSNSTIPLSTGPEDPEVTAGNKARHVESEAAFNAGQIQADKLHYSPDLQVYGVGYNDVDILGLDEWLSFLDQSRATFSGLRISPDYINVIGQGDWTATASRLSGKLTGTWKVPSYLSETSIEPTGAEFDVLHYTIARWQNGLITHLKILGDPLGILNQVRTS